MKISGKLSTVLIAGALFTACGKKDQSTAPVVNGNVVSVIETSGGITYKMFTGKDNKVYKGILVMGSGNDENNPAAGSLDGAAESDLCQKAAENGYLAAIVQYRKTKGTADWNGSAQLIGEDYNTCIMALAAKYGADKNKSVVGGFSYASFMLLTNSAYFNSLPYCNGILAACGATGIDQASKLHNPIYSIACSGNNEGDYSGKALYDKIPGSLAIKAQSAGLTDNSCSGHCNGSNWTDKLYTQLVKWIP